LAHANRLVQACGVRRRTLSDADSDRHCDADRDRYCDGDVYTNEYSDQHPNGDSNRYGDVYANQYSDEHPDGDRNRNGDADQYTDKYSNGDGNRYADQYAYCNSNARRGTAGEWRVRG